MPQRKKSQDNAMNTYVLTIIYNLGEMDRFLGTYSLTRLSEEETDN